MKKEKWGLAGTVEARRWHSPFTNDFASENSFPSKFCSRIFYGRKQPRDKFVRARWPEMQRNSAFATGVLLTSWQFEHRSTGREQAVLSGIVRLEFEGKCPD